MPQPSIIEQAWKRVYVDRAQFGEVREFLIRPRDYWELLKDPRILEHVGDVSTVPDVVRLFGIPLRVTEDIEPLAMP